MQKQQQVVQTEVAKISKQHDEIVAEQLRMKKELEVNNNSRSDIVRFAECLFAQAALDASSSGYASWHLWLQERMNVAARNLGSAAAYVQTHASVSRDKWNAFYDANLAGERYVLVCICVTQLLWCCRTARQRVQVLAGRMGTGANTLRCLSRH